jgi:hypothetical protein
MMASQLVEGASLSIAAYDTAHKRGQGYKYMGKANIYPKLR